MCNSNKTKMSKLDSDNMLLTTPIKMTDVDNQIKRTFEVVKGYGLCAGTVALVHLPEQTHGGAKRVLRVLLDSGSDGDLLFHKRGTPRMVPFQERIAKQSWKTSNGTFSTTYLAKIVTCFPDFSRSKLVDFRPDVVEIPENAPDASYDLIIGIESLIKLGAILDFS